MTHPPVIILVRPQMGENIGAAARAMMNFGLNELRLVAPRDGWPNEKARSMAAHATPLLDAAKLYTDFAGATADLHRLYATSARGRDMAKPTFTAREAAARCREEAGDGLRTGLVFGPERTGLENEEIARSDALVTIPTDPDNASLNLAQSVVILGYEWFAGSEAAVAPQTTSRAASPVNRDNFPALATHGELEGFFDQLESALDDTRFFKTPQLKPKMWRAIRSLFVRASLSEQEVRTLRGLVRALHAARD